METGNYLRVEKLGDTTRNTDTSDDSESDESSEYESERLTTYLPVSEVDITATRDKYPSYNVTGITELENGSLVIMDYSNKNVKLLNNNHEVISTLHSIFEPWDVAFAKDEKRNLVIATFPEVRLLQFLTIKAATQVLHWYPIKSGNEYRGVAVSREHIITTCKYDGTTNAPSVHILDRSGEIVKEIYENPDGGKMFQDPDYVTVGGPNNLIFVSDQGKRAVTAFNEDGEFLSLYQSDTIIPMGLSFSNASGMVYVCDQGTNSILYLTAECELIRRYQTRDGELVKPQAVCFGNKCEELIVSISGSSSLLIL